MCHSSEEEYIVNQYDMSSINDSANVIEAVDRDTSPLKSSIGEPAMTFLSEIKCQIDVFRIAVGGNFCLLTSMTITHEEVQANFERCL